MHFIDAIAARVRAVPSIRYVGTIGEFSKAEAGGFASQAVPAVYIGIPDETSTRRDSFGGVASKKTEVYPRVFLVALDVRAAAKGELSTAFIELREKVLDAIEGFVPEGCTLPLLQINGTLFGSTTAGVVIYDDTYHTQLKGRNINVTTI